MAAVTLTGSKNLIEQILVNEYEIELARVISSAYEPHRNRLARRLQAEGNELGNLRDWTFRYIENDVTVLANTSSIALPGTWADSGRNGGVWLRFGGAAGQSRRLDWIRPGEMMQLHETTSYRGDPQKYTIDQGYVLRVWPYQESAAMPLHIYYHAVGPAIDPTLNPGGLDFFPSQWWDLLYEMVKLADMPHHGDLAARQVQQAKVESMTFSMVAKERQGKPEADHLPRYPGASDVFLNEDFG